MNRLFNASVLFHIHLLYIEFNIFMPWLYPVCVIIITYELLKGPRPIARGLIHGKIEADYSTGTQ